MSNTFNPSDLIDTIHDGKTFLYMVDGITFTTYGQAFRKAIAVLKMEAINRARLEELN
ncbi:MAG: hypothetical protein KAR40_08005 [Candidatus Sabulitectum sp.]|nr:hypothetical protein [Candidatus Sabulitectum sp.]